MTQGCASKRCHACRRRKPLVAFHHDRRTRDGHCSDCMTCACERARRWYLENRKRADRLRSKWRAADPARRTAHDAVYRAIRSGRIKRPCRCSSCACQCVPQAHHADHRRPLSVTWLCASCHRLHHKTFQHMRAGAVVRPHGLPVPPSGTARLALRGAA